MLLSLQAQDSGCDTGKHSETVRPWQRVRSAYRRINCQRYGCIKYRSWKSPVRSGNPQSMRTEHNCRFSEAGRLTKLCLPQSSSPLRPLNRVGRIAVSRNCRFHRCASEEKRNPYPQGRDQGQVVHTGICSCHAGRDCSKWNIRANI